jgi:CRISPR-associated Cas5-like protein
MSYGVRLRVWGGYACFTRPEMKVERVSYDVITPSAARGILEAIHWKPAIRWIVDRIRVLKPIRFESIRRNEVGHKIPASNVAQAMRAGSIKDLRSFVEDDRQQRAATVLRDVSVRHLCSARPTASGDQGREGCTVHRRLDRVFQSRRVHIFPQGAGRERSGFRASCVRLHDRRQSPAAAGRA